MLDIGKEMGDYLPLELVERFSSNFLQMLVNSRCKAMESALYHGIQHLWILTDVTIILEAGLLVGCLRLTSVFVITSYTTRA